MSQFFNIFEKRETTKEHKLIKNTNIKIIDKPLVIADYRERNSTLASEIVNLNIDVKFRELKVGDYIVNNIVIERKTVADFISSMINKRIFNQLEELQQYEKKLLLIEGIEENELYNDNNPSVSANAIRGLLLSILLKFKIPILFSKNEEDSAKFFNILLKKREKEISLNAKKKSFNKKEQLQFILEGFPGIGPKTAKKLLKEFKTIKNIINSPDEELKKILGKKSESIIKLRDEKY